MVVIGGVAAGTSAASKAKRIDPSADVKIVQEESVLEEILGVDGQVNGIKTNTKPEINSDFVDLGICISYYMIQNNPYGNIGSATIADSIDNSFQSEYIPQQPLTGISQDCLRPICPPWHVMDDQINQSSLAQDTMLKHLQG